jgi:chaperonin cofactor prefoldin
MTQDKNDPKKPAGEAAGRTKRPTTIDLKATEIKPEAAKTEEPASASATPPTEAGAAAASAPEDSAKTAGAPDAAKEAEPAGASEPDAPPRDAGRAAPERAPKGFPWPLAAVAAAVVFFAVGLAAGQYLLHRFAPEAAAPAPVVAQTPPEVLSRIARLETALAAAQNQKPDPQLQARVDRLEKQVGAVSKDDPQLQARLSKIEGALNAAPKLDPQLQERIAKLETQLATPRASDPQLQSRIAAAESAVKALQDMIAARDNRHDDLAELARDARERATSAATAAEAAQKSQAASPDARADLDALTKRLASLEENARNSQAELAKRMSAEDAKGRFAVAAIALREAVDGGLPFQAELAAVKAQSADPAAVKVLEPFAASGVPSAVALGRELAALMPSIWKIARKDEAQEGTFLERLQANASKIVRIRPAGEVTGDDPMSVSARIEARAGRADINGALAELAKLPADAREPAAAWIKKAQAYNAAIAAARTISQTALGALVKSGS